MKFNDMFGGEDRVFSGDIFSEDGLEVSALSFSFGHDEISFFN